MHAASESRNNFLKKEMRLPDKAGSASGSRVASSLEEAEGTPRKELHAFRAA